MSAQIIEIAGTGPHDGMRIGVMSDMPARVVGLVVITETESGVSSSFTRACDVNETTVRAVDAALVDLAIGITERRCER